MFTKVHMYIDCPEVHILWKRVERLKIDLNISFLGISKKTTVLNVILLLTGLFNYQKRGNGGRMFFI